MILAVLGLVTVFSNSTPTPSPAPICRPATTLIETKTDVTPAPQLPCVSNEMKVVADTSRGVPSELTLVLPSPSPALSASPSSRVRVCTREVTPLPLVQPDHPTYRAAPYSKNSATVLVKVSAKGQLTDATILHSSGDLAIDQAALRAARETTYLPRIRHCKPVPGTYIIQEDRSITTPISH